MAKITNADELKQFDPTKPFFVGIDSDGCVFDTMEIKHKECFIPNIIKHWNLQSVSKYAREAGEFINLYSKWRGVNRWPALTMLFDLLSDRDEVKQRGAVMPDVPTLRDWISRETKLGNPALKAEVEKTGDAVLTQALTWSEAVNTTIEDMVKGIPPFPFVRDSLEKMKEQADLFVVSQTPCEALIREWQEHDMEKYVHCICGQEYGTKTEHLEFASKGKYEAGHVLMIGDAPGDMKAAKANNALFFPINPGEEQGSWEELFKNGIDRFFNGTFAGEYETALIDEFNKHLPEKPSWK